MTTASQALSAYSANSKINPVQITDTAEAIGALIDSLQVLEKANKIISIFLSGPSSVISVTAAQLASDSGVLLKVGSSFLINAQGTLSAGQAATVPSALLTKLTTQLFVSDLGYNVSQNLDKLEALAKTGHLGSIVVPGATSYVVSVTPSQLTSDADALAKLTGNFGIQINGALTVTQALAINATIRSHLSEGVTIADTQSNVNAHFNDLASFRLNNGIADLNMTTIYNGRIDTHFDTSHHGIGVTEKDYYGSGLSAPFTFDLTATPIPGDPIPRYAGEIDKVENFRVSIAGPAHLLTPYDVLLTGTQGINPVYVFQDGHTQKGLGSYDRPVMETFTTTGNYSAASGQIAQYGSSTIEVHFLYK